MFLSLKSFLITFSRAGLHGEGAVFAQPPDDLAEDIKKFGFNKFASDRIPFNRTLPDVRHKDCPGIFLCNYRHFEMYSQKSTGCWETS